jgi:4-hydroxy-tetrahydrodipicolinate synthase
MLPETVAQIAAHPRVIGIKDATGDLSRVAKFRELLGKNFLLYSGEDDQGCEHVCLGGDGVISVTANAAPALEQAMLAYAQIGDRSKAEAINQKLLPLHKAMFLESNPIPAKRAMNILGKMGPAVRPPLCELDEVHEPTLKEALIIAEAI